MGGFLISVGTLYFLLATRRDVFARVARFVPRRTEPTEEVVTRPTVVITSPGNEVIASN